MKNNVSRHDLVDMITFDRVDFEKNISLSVKKKVKIESKWELKKLGDVSIIDYGTRIVKKSEQGTIYPVYGGGGETFKSDNYNRENVFIISRFGMSPKCVRYISGKFFLNDSGLTLNTANSDILNQGYLNQFLFLNQEMVYLCGQGVAQKNLEIETFNSLKIPLPPLDIQQKIVSEIEVFDAKEKEAKEEVEKQKENIKNIISKVSGELTSLSNINTKIGSGATPRGGEGSYKQSGISLIRSQNIYDNTFYEKGLAFIDDEQAEKLKGVTVEKNDILFNITGASICRCCIVPEKYLPARVNPVSYTHL